MSLATKIFLGLVAVIVAFGLGFAYLSSEFTNCFGSFPSSAAAERAADTMRTLGFDASINVHPGRTGVTFSDGETGDDASEFRAAFHSVVKSEGGELSHPGDGCLQRPHFN